MRYTSNVRATQPNIVVIGGGTGSFTLLSGLKKHTPHLTALVSMADNGGSTGVLRDELGALPPGDIRQCLVALSNAPEMRDLFNFRFNEGSLAGHSFGNLFLAAFESMANSNFTDAVKLASKVLNITGQVLPATLDNVHLVLTKADGSRIEGEATLDHADNLGLNRPHVSLEPAARLTPEGKQALLDADLIVIAPGSLYGSLAAVLVVEGMAETLAKARAPKLYVCNLITEKGQTDSFQVHDFADEIERFLNRKVRLDYVLYNTQKPNAKLLKRYAAQGGSWVDHNKATLQKRHYKTIGDVLMADEKKNLIRHDPHKIAETIVRLHKMAQKAYA